MTAVSVGALTEGNASVPGEIESESRIASTRRVGPRTIAYERSRSVFSFYACAVVRDVRAPSGVDLNTKVKDNEHENTDGANLT
jgi:hypothetical protein